MFLVLLSGQFGCTAFVTNFFLAQGTESPEQVPSLAHSVLQHLSPHNATESNEQHCHAAHADKLNPNDETNANKPIRDDVFIFNPFVLLYIFLDLHVWLDVLFFLFPF